MRKAQGLPLNVLVLGALAILVLVVLGGAFMVGGGSIFANIARFLMPHVGGAELNSMRQTCEGYCTNLQGRAYSSPDEAKNSARNNLFCLQYYNTTAYQGTDEDHCYPQTPTQGNDLLSITCTITTATGTVTIGEDECTS